MTKKIINMKETHIRDKCPKCGHRSLKTDGETIWCINKKCDYEWFP